MRVHCGKCAHNASAWVIEFGWLRIKWLAQNWFSRWRRTRIRIVGRNIRMTAESRQCDAIAAMISAVWFMRQHWRRCCARRGRVIVPGRTSLWSGADRRNYGGTLTIYYKWFGHNRVHACEDALASTTTPRFASTFTCANIISVMRAADRSLRFSIEQVACEQFRSMLIWRCSTRLETPAHLQRIIDAHAIIARPEIVLQHCTYTARERSPVEFIMNIF